MRRLLAIMSAVGLLCGALGCHSCGFGHKVHGRCDCDEGPLYGCHCDTPGHGPVIATPAPAAAPRPVAEPIKEMPKGEPKGEEQ